MKHSGDLQMKIDFAFLYPTCFVEQRVVLLVAGCAGQPQNVSYVEKVEIVKKVCACQFPHCLASQKSGSLAVRGKLREKRVPLFLGGIME